ncbi:MAG: hypothetical protein ABWW66_00205 [Archaeoglobaceae archaeon]
MELRLEEDEGVEVLGTRVKCDYLIRKSKVVACVKFCCPGAESSALSFAKAYAKFRGLRYAVVVSDDVLVFDLKEGREVKLEEIEDDALEPDEKFGRLAALLFELTSCEVKKCVS